MCALIEETEKLFSGQSFLVIILTSAVIALWKSTFNLQHTVKNNTDAMNNNAAKLEILSQEVTHSSEQCADANRAVLKAFNDTIRHNNNQPSDDEN